MKKILESINDKLDSESFAKSYNKPHIAGWIKRNFESGNWSKDDYNKIVKWIDHKNPNLENYDFKSALSLADAYVKSVRGDNFSNNVDVTFKNLVMKFDSGKEWHKFGTADCNGVIHKLMYDCSDELHGVFEGKIEAFALIDDQENILCIAINEGDHLRIIGRLGNDPINCHDEINSLCVRKGMPLSHHAFSYEEMVDSLKSKLIDINNIKDIKGFIGKLKPQDIVDCNLIKYCHYCNLSNMLSIYLKCKQDCILKYIMASLVAHGLTKGTLYKTVKQMINNNPEFVKEFTVESGDSRPFVELMNKYQSEIIKL